MKQNGIYCCGLEFLYEVLAGENGNFFAPVAIKDSKYVSVLVDV